MAAARRGRGPRGQAEAHGGNYLFAGDGGGDVRIAPAALMLTQHNGVTRVAGLRGVRAGLLGPQPPVPSGAE
jgi:hypothetical protein